MGARRRAGRRLGHGVVHGGTGRVGHAAGGGPRRAQPRGISELRLPPTPATRSRANDTPVLDHVAGGGPYGGQVTSLAVARTLPSRLRVLAGRRGLPIDRPGRDVAAGRLGVAGERRLRPHRGPGGRRPLFAVCDDGLFKTVDAGGLWRQLDLDNPGAPVIAAADPRVLYDGALRSRDGGRRWSMAASPNDAPRCHQGTLVVDPRDAESLFCVTEDGLMSSRSGGERWMLVPGPAGVELSGLLAAPGAPDWLLASTDDGPVYAITNRGATWTPLGHVPGGDVSDLRADDSGTIVYGVQGDGLVRSGDGGRTWHARPLDRPPFSLWTYAIDPRDPQVVYVRDVGRSCYVSLDGGYTWQLRARGLTRAAATVIVHEGPRSALFAAVGADVLTSDDGGDDLGRASRTTPSPIASRRGHSPRTAAAACGFGPARAPFGCGPERPPGRRTPWSMARRGRLRRRRQG